MPPFSGGLMISETNLETLAKAKGKNCYLKHQERLTSNIGYSETDGARDLIKTNLVVLSEAPWGQG